MADDTVRRSIGRSQRAALLVLCLGFFMVLLDQTIVNVAIPSMVDGLGARLDQVLWVLSAYTLTYATLLILASRLGNAFGQRNLYAAGLVVFGLGSAACGQEASGLSDRELSGLRAWRFGFVFQQFHLLDGLGFRLNQEHVNA